MNSEDKKIITDELFSQIISKLKNGELISSEMSIVFELFSDDENLAYRFLKEFLDKIKDSNNYNSEIMNLIDNFLNGTICIKELSFGLFNAGKTGYTEFDDLKDRSLIRHDNIKLGLCDYIYPYKTPQFSSIYNESYFEKMIRVLFEFTRGDEPYLRGVCIDYCLFLCALDMVKNNKTDFIIKCAIENEGGNNYFIQRQNEEEEILDPFNGIYTVSSEYMNSGIVLVVLNSLQINVSSVRNLIECKHYIRPSSLVSSALGNNNTTATQLTAVRYHEEQLVQKKSIELGELEHDN